MLPNSNQLPTLGYLHKIVCDCLGLWHSDNEDITFPVAATEKDRRIALRQAFEAIRKEDGVMYGTLDDLVVVTAKLAPQDTVKVKKRKTIQAYVNHLSKTDFESVHEYGELQQYIKVLLTERYFRWGVSDLAVSFYVSALAHYREFVREHACDAQSQNNSYECFVSQDLRLLIGTAANTLLPDDAFPHALLEEPWPMKGFADTASRITGVSLHKLHQYHQFQQEGPHDKHAWARDFTSQPVNTRSKQVIERLRKYNRMKWETFYSTLQPLTYHLPKTNGEKAFAMHAFAAMVAHNLNVHAADCGAFQPPAQRSLTSVQVEHNHLMPSSDLLDRLFDDGSTVSEAVIEQAFKRYRAMVVAIRSLPGSLKLDNDIPNCFEQVYAKQHRPFSEGAWYVPQINGPNWLNEWARARNALRDGDALLALSHFKTALEQAKYAAGPLFIPFYIQVCAFCKLQYRLCSERNEEELFDRFYEGLGSNVTNYASLMGYTPQYERDAKTLMPHGTHKQKTGLIIREIDALAKTLRK
jgi:hypothetical protein